MIREDLIGLLSYYVLLSRLFSLNDVFNCFPFASIRVSVLIVILDYSVAANCARVTSPLFATLESRVKEWTKDVTQLRTIYKKVCQVLQAVEQK
jgi:hypothetical protein